MAGQVPDPRTLNSWEDAFQHPLPVVRKLEQQLRRNIDDNRQKLRTLVGASYRDLLGTAERIIEMDDQMQTVETYEADIGRKCNARMVEKIADNHLRMQRTKDGEKRGKYSAIAPMKVLQSALMALSRTIKACGNALLASKLLVLSRLLHKSLSESGQPLLVLEDSRKKLGTLRRKLISYIERTLGRPSTDKSLLADTLCAYALVTSSTFKEALRHFLQVRYERLESAQTSPSEENVLKMLSLYSQTFLDSRELFPRRFEDALSQLARRPLLLDEQIRAVSELNLDIYGSWIAESVRTFTPWVRHDQLTTSEVTDALESWAKQSQQSLLELVNTHLYLREASDVHAVMHFRYKVISKYAALSTGLRSEIYTKAIMDMRTVFFQKLEGLAFHAATIPDLPSDDEQISKSLEPRTDESSMWDIARKDIDLDHGAFKLRQSLIQKRRGTDTFAQTENEKLDEWIKRIEVVLDITEEMRSCKWDDDLDNDLEDLGDGQSLQDVLNRQDSDRLRDKLGEAIEATLTNFMAKVTSAAPDTEYASFYLRIWREVDQRRRALGSRLSVPGNEMSLSVLHRNIAQAVSKGVTEDYAEAVKTQSLAAVTLWDGSPLLPIQPSPSTFRFLTKLHQAMSDAGADLWSPPCVFELQRILLSALGIVFDDLAFTNPPNETPLTNGHVEDEGQDHDHEPGTPSQPSERSNARKERLIQNLFNVHYLRCVLRRSGSEGSELDQLVQAMKTHADLEDASHQRLSKNASEYWKRTYLLFGLLAPGRG